MEINVGEVIKLKKKHPCGGFDWEVLRIGADIKLKCTTCGHLMMISRQAVEKAMKK